jgi:hypothetical protein
MENLNKISFCIIHTHTHTHTSQDSKATLGSAWATYWDNGLSKGSWADILTGLPPRMVFSGALIALQFVIYDYCRVQLHVSPNELMEFLDVMADVTRDYVTKS